jgi:ribose transport system permease protein
VLVTVVPSGDSGKLALGLAVVLGVGLAAGLLNGLLVTRLGITSLVATLGMNAVLVGTVLQVTHGSINYKVTKNWADAASSKVVGVPTPTVVALVLVVAVAAYMRWSVWGRRFDLVGASPLAARSAGLPVARYQLISYVAAGVCYAFAGALLAGFLGSPQLFAGNDYLLPTIAAVVLGGTSLVGGVGSVVATGMGALFLTQLEQVVRGMGAPASVQFVIQGSIIALGMAVGAVQWRRLRGLARLRHLAQPLAPAPSAASPTSQSPPTLGADDPIPGETSPASHPRDESGKTTL